MALPQRARLYAPFLAAGLLVPLLWGVVAIALPEDRLATTKDALIVEGTFQPGSGGGGASNLTVGAVIDPGQQPPVSQGDVLRVHLPPGGLGVARLEPGTPTVVALWERAPQASGESGENATEPGWVLRDAKTGSFWSLQDLALQGAIFSAVPSVAGAALVGYVLGLPRRVRPFLPDVDVPATTGGVLLGVRLGSLLTAMSDPSTLLFSPGAQGAPMPTTLGVAVAAMAGVAVTWERPLLLPSGARTATVGGLGLLLGVPLTLIGLWEGRVTTAYALT
ncbi:MAG: hypothetical protein R3185_03370, partial [Candidatus Thermoplasmatota archaeon]|nr:hypothetical protein [Candidatus Thermoplasmatota archaeon]